VPDRPALWRLGLSSDSAVLATVATPNPLDRSKPRRFMLDVWDYARLLGRPTLVVPQS